MEIRLGTIGKSGKDKDVHFLDSLSVEQYNKYREALLIIAEIHSNRNLLGIVELNFQEFKLFPNSALEFIKEKSITPKGFNREEGDELVLRINRILLNYLSSIRTFLDHSETFLKRRFGHDSNQVHEFTRITSTIFDKSFAYRFFYKLRNYTQHCGLPIENFELKASTDSIKKLINFNIRFSFNRDKLLSNYDKWGLVTKDLEKMELLFDPHFLVFEVTENIREIARGIEQLNINETITAAKFIKNMTDHLRKENNQVSIFKNIRTVNGNLNYQMEIIPFETIDSIT